MTSDATWKRGPGLQNVYNTDLDAVDLHPDILEVLDLCQHVSGPGPSGVSIVIVGLHWFSEDLAMGISLFVERKRFWQKRRRAGANC
jgi:hypothetical protein